MVKRMSGLRWPLALPVVLGLLLLGCGGSGKPGAPSGSPAKAPAGAPGSGTAKVLVYDRTATRAGKRLRIAYLAECVSNPYCQARLRGMEAAAKKYGFEFKTFDANFNPQTQLRLVQDAVAQGFDGYVFAPTAAAPGCSMWKQFLKPTGKPVVTVDVPMCNDADYTPGVAATVTMVRQAFFDAHVANAFRTCHARCKVAAIGGFPGSDLFTTWERAVARGEQEFPNVDVVSDQPANYDPRVALRVIGDALRAHPDLNMVISPWDDMTRGAEQAITAAGKRPGKDVRIYSTGATKIGVQRVQQGAWNETSIFLPYEESYFAAVALVMALDGKPVNAYVNEAKMPPVTDLRSLYVTKRNAARFRPNY
ncbi:MAG: ribose transport system substrate-binding protein [Solirubrobacteraceae bacterium]|jgi:ABC-type sugar transport system substrate-binding protein|nr:ribose transport system substrate-binding protein [Solirubrobacteraceae bacterium]